MARSLRIALLVGLAQGCTCGDSRTNVALDAVAGAAPDFSILARAEDQRRAADVPVDARTAHDARVRARATRALARIADDASFDGLARALDDEDPIVVAWAAYGLGLGCKGHEEDVIRRLAARATAWNQKGPLASIDPRFALARAIGRCGGPLAEQTLASWVRAAKGTQEPACYALGEIAGRRGTLGDDTVTALLDAAEAGQGAALHPLSRVERMNDAFSARILGAARAAQSKPSAETRAFGIRAFVAAGADAAPDLEAIAVDASRTIPERVQAARALAKLGDPGRASAASALAKSLPDAKDAIAITALGGAQIHVLASLVSALGSDPPKSAEPSLRALASLRAPGSPPASLVRRLAVLRCTAAQLLARGAFDGEPLQSCDDRGTVAWEQARLASVLRHRLAAGAARAAFIELARSKNVRVREAAIDAIGSHPELEAAGRAIIAQALTDVSHPGVVATAAEIVHAHPNRFMVLSAKEIKRALDPRAPAPTTNPEQDLDPEIARALDVAMTHPWTEDLVETRFALVEAAAAVRAPHALERAKDACADPNVTMREHATLALRALGEAKITCAPPATMPLAKDLGPPAPAKITFVTDAGDLAIVLDGDLAPVTSARVIELAKSGFYKGIVFHRVVPGFVVQFGDPWGDGYGGSGTLLRSETSPKPFAALDVGVALAGRDTGSSQLFVTLARYPHLDGEYPLVGHAEGDWNAVFEGDAITDVRVAAP